MIILRARHSRQQNKLLCLSLPPVQRLGLYLKASTDAYLLTTQLQETLLVHSLQKNTNRLIETQPAKTMVPPDQTTQTLPAKRFAPSITSLTSAARPKLYSGGLMLALHFVYTTYE